MNKKLWIVIGVLVLAVIGTSSGLVYNTVKGNNENATKSEMSQLQTTFVQQYGSKAIIKEIVAPEKVYAALWTDGDGGSHVSWNIGGVWAVVWSSAPPTTTPAP